MSFQKGLQKTRTTFFFKFSQISKHYKRKINFTLKSKMDFLVRWTGQNESHDLWLPWKQLRDNPKLHKYLSENGMESWIPKEHRKQEYKG